MTEQLLLVASKASRVANLTAEILEIRRQNFLSPSHAARIIGKFGFVCEAMFGKVGRAATGALRARQYQTKGGHHLTNSLLISLGLVVAFMHTTPPRFVKMCKSSTPPNILYTDASDVPERAAGRYCVGAVLITPKHPSPLYTTWSVPESVVATWLPKKTQIGQLEIFAAPVAIDTWAPFLTDSETLLFIDNTSALASLIRGYSPKEDSCKMVGDFWLRAAKHKIYFFLDHVESKSNLADGPSRFDSTLMSSLGGGTLATRN